MLEVVVHDALEVVAAAGGRAAATHTLKRAPSAAVVESTASTTTTIGLSVPAHGTAAAAAAAPADTGSTNTTVWGLCQRGWAENITIVVVCISRGGGCLHGGRGGSGSRSKVSIIT